MNDALRVLVVDDEAQIRRLLCAALRRAGYETVEAETVREALHMNELCHPAAALVDLGLADRDGLELVALLALQCLYLPRSLLVVPLSAKRPRNALQSPLKLWW